MYNIGKKNFKEINNEIDLIIAGTHNREDYKYIYIHLNEALLRELTYDEIVLTCEMVLKIAKTKNRILRFLEKDFWSFIIKIPFQIVIIQELDIAENEELLSNTDYDNENKKILSRLTGLAQEIIELPDDNSKGSELRRSSALSFMGEMIDYYEIHIAKELFMNSVNSKNMKEQFEALQGLETYFSYTEDELKDNEVKILNRIVNETDERTVASTCLQIQINAGIIDEGIALHRMDDWKDKHYYPKKRRKSRD